MVAKLFITLMALAVMTAFVLADEDGDEDYLPVDELMEFVKRGRGRGKNRGGRNKLGPLTRDDMEPCEKYGQACTCDKRKKGPGRFLVCSG
ncbi:uncharacterized protein [Asterias amurensis]|uniref:uncharacterized protein n=1 Tax=Asterias amurensis TaxID=7602 RepID=UPI003AB281BD